MLLDFKNIAADMFAFCTTFFVVCKLVLRLLLGQCNL